MNVENNYKMNHFNVKSIDFSLICTVWCIKQTTGILALIKIISVNQNVK